MPNDVRLATIRAVHDLLQRAGVDKPPVDIEHLADLQGVISITQEPLRGAAAELVPSPRGYVIKVDPYSNPERQRFSIAHEIAHTFFRHTSKSFREAAVTLSRRSDNLAYRAEETLCDIAASEMLMPIDLFKVEANGREPSIETMSRVATLFRTSLEATALRYACVTSYPVQVTTWQRRYGTLYPKWDRGTRVLEMRPFALRRPQSHTTWCIAKAYYCSERIAKQDLELSIYPPERIFIEAQGFRHSRARYVLSIARSPRFGLERSHYDTRA